MGNPNGNPNWKKGVSGNPNGRPKGGVSIVDAIKRKLAEELPDATNEEKRTYLEEIVQKIFDKGLAGDVSMLKDMIDRIDGKAKESLDVNANVNVTEVSEDEVNKLINIYESRRKNKVSEGDSE